MRNETWLRMLSGFVLVGVFAAGALFGAGLLRWTQHSTEALPAASPLPPEPPIGPPGMRGGPVLAMQHELQLDAAQMQQLRSIMQSHRPQLEQLMHDTQAKVRDVLFSIEDELRPSLRPDQVQKLEEWRAHRPPPPIGPPGMGGGPPGGMP